MIAPPGNGGRGAQERSGAGDPRWATLVPVTTVYYTATTLDGYIADPDDSLDWLFVQEIDEDGPLNYAAFIADVGALVMGATTYEWIRARVADGREKWSYTVPTVVLTHRDLPAIEGADVRFTAGDVATVHADLTAAAGGKDVWVVGGGDVAAQFVRAGLIDEMIVSFAPCTLGTGGRLLPMRSEWTLVESAVNGEFVVARWRKSAL